MFLKYIYFCLYINLKYLITHDHTDLTQHFDALHACCSNDLLTKCLYADHRTYILLADIINIIINIFKFMQNNVKRFKKIMSIQINKYRKFVQYNFDNLIWLNNRNIKKIRFSKKLNDKMLSFYKILEKKSASYKMKLSISIKIWNVFYFNLFKKNSKNFVDDQIFEVFKSIETSKENEWMMNNILNFKYYDRNK